MGLKKINAVLGLLLSAVCLTHVVTEVCYVVVGGDVWTHLQIIAKICGAIAILHILISCYMIFISHEGKRISPYPRENMSTLLQRISGFLMILLLFFHVGLAEKLLARQDGSLWFFILNVTAAILCYGTVLLHIALSFSRALITLGALSSRKTQRRLDRILWIVLGLLFIAASILITYAYAKLYLFSTP